MEPDIVENYANQVIQLRPTYVQEILGKANKLVRMEAWCQETDFKE